MGSQLLQQHFASKHHDAFCGQYETDLCYTSHDILKAVKLFNVMLGIFYHGICFCKLGFINRRFYTKYLGCIYKKKL